MTMCPACNATTLERISSISTCAIWRCGNCRSALYESNERSVSHNDQYSDDDDWDSYLDSQNLEHLSQRHREVATRLAQLLKSTNRPWRLFDIGAGAGEFLRVARSSGFLVGGNDIADRAIRETKDRQGIDLVKGDDLLSLPGGEQTVVTMWCVLAHADDADELLGSVYHLLAQDGVLYFHTPRWCLIDVLGISLFRLTRARSRRVIDRRINPLHRRLYSKDGLVAQLSRAGFEVISIDASVAYGLKFEAYFRSLGLGTVAAKVLGTTFDRLASIGLVPRNTLEVYARPVTNG